MNEEMLKELEYIRNLKDEDIDLSDMPELTNEQLEKMVPSHFYKPIKKQVTIRLDADLLAVLKSTGDGYQTKINNILREAVISGNYY